MIQGRYVMPCPLEQILPAAPEVGVIVQVRLGTAPNPIEITSGKGTNEVSVMRDGIIESFSGIGDASSSWPFVNAACPRELPGRGSCCGERVR